MPSVSVSHCLNLIPGFRASVDDVKIRTRSSEKFVQGSMNNHWDMRLDESELSEVAQMERSDINLYRIGKRYAHGGTKKKRRENPSVNVGQRLERRNRNEASNPEKKKGDGFHGKNY